MRKVLILNVLTLFVLIQVFAQTETKIEFEKYSLENGLTVIISPDHSSPIVSVRVWYKVGSKDEITGKAGIARISGQLMSTVGELVGPNKHDELIEGVGGTPRFTVDYDKSQFAQEVPSNALQLVLWLEADRMNSIFSALKETEFEKLKSRLIDYNRIPVVERGVRSWRNELFTLSYPEDYPYHNSFMGRLDDVENLQFNDAVEFIEEYYVPNNAILVVTGDIDLDLTKYWIESYFADIKSGDIPEKKEYEFPGFSGEKSKTIKTDDAVSHVFINYPFLKMGFKETYAMDMVAQILGNGESARLYQRLVKERQVAQYINVTPWSMELNSHFLVEVMGAPGISSETLMKEMNAVMSNCKDNPFTDAEVEKAKNKLKIWLSGWVDTNAGKSFLFGAFESIFENPSLITKEISKYDHITADDLNSVLKKYIIPENKNILIYSGAE